MKRSNRFAAFSLVEVTLALGLCAFVLVALIGLLSSGLRTGRESEDQVHAANLASQIITMRSASPTNGFPNAAIPYAAMTKAYGDAYAGAEQYVGFDGMLTTAGAAAYRITCKAGTNAMTGSRLAQVHVTLSWPPAAQPANASGRYEILTYIPLN